MKSRLIAFATVIVLALATALPVFAHAELIRSIPESNAALDISPAQIELFFTEPLEASFSSVKVLDSTGKQIDNGDSRVDPLDTTHLTVSIRSLPDGVYTVAWQALSSVDGHLTTGAYPFAVGDVSAAELEAAQQASRQVKVSIGEIIARWLTYLSIATLVGGTLFVLVAWQPIYQSLKEGKMSFNAPWRRMASIAIIVLAVASVLAWLTQAGQVSGSEIVPPWSNAAGNVLFNTRYGVLIIARLGLLIAIAAFLPQANTARDRWIGLSLSVLVLLTISFGSHAAADAQPALPIAADFVHMIAASVWVGGLTHFVAGMWAARQFDPKFRAKLTAQLIPRFSALALVSVGVLIITGVYMSVLRLGSWQAFNDTLYGRTLIVKLILALPMIAIGAVNLFGITPAMKQAASDNRSAASPAAQGLVDRFRNIITSEITMGILLFLSVGLLTTLPPAQTTSTGSASITGSQTVDDLTIELDITPGKVGINTFTLDLTSGGQPVFNTSEVLLRFTPASGNLPPSEATLSAQGNGKYSVKGAFLSMPDTWQVQAVVRRNGSFDAYANFDTTVGATGATQSFPWHQLAGGFLLAGALAYLFAFSVLGRTQAQMIGLGIVPALALAVVSVVVFYTEPANAQANEIVNPIPPNSDSVAAGQALYQVNCVPCHGASGKGDGPVGLTLSPRPADLQQHAIPGVHTDGQLYLWVSDGFPGSVMPAFRNSLSDEERWHLVNFIRTFANRQE